MTRIKICGITQLEDAVVAVEAGADALGFVFADSPRQISPEAARNIIRQLPPFVLTAGVFVGDNPEVEQIADECGLDILQIHTGYSRQFVERLRERRLVLGVRVRDETSLENIPGLEYASAVLLDSYHPEVAGGTGRKFDWSLAQKASRLNRPLVLSGGLGPENVTEAIQQVRPYAVDVSSGVESSPGRKDKEKLRVFIERARSAHNC